MQKWVLEKYYFQEIIICKKVYMFPTGVSVVGVADMQTRKIV
jgi:hypothetical protein